MATAEGVAKTVIIRTHDGQRIKLRCPVCQDETWLEAQGAPDVQGFQPMLVANSTNKGMISMPITQLVCSNCGCAIPFVSVENVTIENARDD